MSTHVRKRLSMLYLHTWESHPVIRFSVFNRPAHKNTQPPPALYVIQTDKTENFSDTISFILNKLLLVYIS